MVDGVLEFIATVILNFLLNKAENEVTKEAAKIRLAKQRNEDNSANAQAYAHAIDRADRRKAALALINRTPRSH